MGIVRRPYKIIGYPHQGTHTIGNWQSDNAVDIALPVGTPLYAVADGVIGSAVGSQGRGGRFAGLRFTLVGKVNSFWYGHLSKLKVKAGQRVKKGQLVGYSGSANGVAHLHFASYDGHPEKYLDFKANSPDVPAAQQGTQTASPNKVQMADLAAQELNKYRPGQDFEPQVPGPEVPQATQEVPGSVDMPYQPREIIETWQRLASDPLASPETRRIAERLSSGETQTNL